MSRSEDRPLTTCADPIDAAVLTDYWLALLNTADEAGVEAHLLTCDACGDRLRGIIQLSEGLRTLAQSGALTVVVPEGFVRHVARCGRQVREYDASTGQTVLCTVSGDDDFLIARLAADLGDIARVDLSLCDPGGVERQRLSDIPRTDAGRVIYQQSMAMAKGSPTTSMTARLLAIDDTGSERLLGEYTFQHTRTLPGPPSWEW